MLKKSSEVRSASAVSGFMKLMVGAGAGAGLPRNCDRVWTL